MSNNSELTIKTLASEIRAMAPIEIIVNNGEYYWKDDLDLTDIMDNHEETERVMKEHLQKYYDILNLDLIITNISYEIVSFHHSIVRITTL